MASRPSTSPRAVARRVAKLTALQYQLRIELKHVEPLIWRRVLVPENVTLARLHAILLGAMGWGGGHLHEFRIARCRYGIPDEEDWQEGDPLFDERRFRLKGLVESGARRFTYLYDFGDGWEHSVKIEDLVPPSSNDALIRCIACENAGPPEDVGGPDGYAEFLTAINNPAHEEHASMLRWVGGPFDPAAFAIADANERLPTIKT
jgi:hypothetical protein